VAKRKPDVPVDLVETMSQISLGTKLRVLRSMRRMSQTDLARLVGIERVNISYYENGHQTPAPETLAKLEAAFDLRFDSPVVEAAFGILNNDAARAKHVRLALAVLGDGDNGY
jgi:transcriptional regulator with XRE-family HTH domain